MQLESSAVRRTPSRWVCSPSRCGCSSARRASWRRTRTARGATGSATSTGRTPPKGPPWAHNSLGASVHTALRSWFDLPAAQRRPGRAGTPAAGDLGAGRLPRRGAGAGGLSTRALGWLRALRRRAGSRLRAARRRADGRRQDADAGPVRPGRPHRRRRRRAGDRRLQDRPDGPRRRRRPRLAGAGAVRVRRRAGVPPAVPPGRAAPPADRHGRRARAHRRVARPARAAGRADRGRRRWRPRRSSPPGRDPGRGVSRPRPAPICGWCDFRRICPAGSQRPGNEPWAVGRARPRAAADRPD